MEANTQAYLLFVKDVEKIKISAVYKKLREELSLNEHRNSTAHLIEAVDTASQRYVEAVDIFLIAKNEEDKYKLFYDEEMSKLNATAQEELEKLKQRKKFTSQITADAKKNWILINKAQEYKKLEVKMRQLKIGRERLENMKDAWKGRKSSLQTQLRAVDPNKPLILGQNNE